MDQNVHEYNTQQQIRPSGRQFSTERGNMTSLSPAHRTYDPTSTSEVTGTGAHQTLT